MGPFELLDFVGLDTTSFIAAGWRSRVAAAATNDTPTSGGIGLSTDLVEEIPMLEKMVAEGKLGRKTPDKGGFYEYDARGKPVRK